MADSRYLTEIPARADAVDVLFHTGGRVAERHYKLGPAVIAERHYNEHGVLVLERSLSGGVRHGAEHRFDDDGWLLSRTYYREGLEHGLAQQWSRDGLLLGEYSMEAGSGWDLWWQTFTGSSPILAEARCYRNGRRCGDEWWFLSADRLSAAACFWDDLRHGAEWRWGGSGNVERGFPRFWLQDQRVTKRVYLRAAKTDGRLLVPDVCDSEPWRTFPEVVCNAIQRHR